MDNASVARQTSRSATPAVQESSGPSTRRQAAHADAHRSRIVLEPEEQTEESERDRIERLGRERPAQFKSLWSEAAFCYSILMSQLMAEYFVSGFNVLVPTLMDRLDIPASSAVWPAASFALTTSALVLPCGRLADMLGGKVVYLTGLIWFCLWSFICGFSKNELMLDFGRALQGIGPALFLPSGVMLLGSVYRPGPRKNLVFSIYGGSAPLGFFLGILMAGLSGSFLEFRWYFWIGAIIVFTTVVAAFWAIPSDRGVQRQVKMDWLGSFFLVSGLFLTVFALTDGSHAPRKWAESYIIITLVIGVILLGLAWWVEGYVASNPLIPFDMFTIAHIKPLFIALFFNYGCLGVFLLYSTLYMTSIMGATPVQVAAWMSPMCIGGIVLSLAGGYILHLLPGTVLVLVSAVGWIVSALMFAVAPEDAVYWAYVFPAMIGATIGIDITFNVANVFITTNLSSKRQGLAGALMNVLLYLGIAVMLAFADITQTETAHLGTLKSYRAVFWFMLVASVVSLIIMIGFVRIPKAESALTADEREALLSVTSDQSIELHQRARSD